MPASSNGSLFSVITGQMAKQFPNSGTLVYRYLTFWIQQASEFAHILLRTNILNGDPRLGHGIASLAWSPVRHRRLACVDAINERL
jgi:hypothetical protein